MKKLIASLQSTFVFLLSTYMLLFICKQGVRASTAHLSPELYFCLVFILTGFDFLYTCTMKRKLTLHRAPNSIAKKLIRYNLYYPVNLRTSKLTSFYFDKTQFTKSKVFASLYTECLVITQNVRSFAFCVSEFTADMNGFFPGTWIIQQMNSHGSHLSGLSQESRSSVTVIERMEES